MNLKELQNSKNWLCGNLNSSVISSHGQISDEAIVSHRFFDCLVACAFSTVFFFFSLPLKFKKLRIGC